MTSRALVGGREGRGLKKSLSRLQRKLSRYVLVWSFLTVHGCQVCFCSMSNAAGVLAHAAVVMFNEFYKPDCTI